MAPFDVTGKVALMTGGNSGIGLGMADALAAAGAAVCVWGTNETKNEQAAKRLRKHGRPVGRARVQRGGRGGRRCRLRRHRRQARSRRCLLRQRGRERARHGIRANAVLPGWIDTPMTDTKLRWDKFVGKVLPRVPMRRWAVPEDFGGIAVYLTSNASAYHTGDTFVIDGG